MNLMQMMEAVDRGEMVECSHCNGYGSSLKEDSDTCSKCHGRGLVAVPKPENKDKEI